MDTGDDSGLILQARGLGGDETQHDLFTVGHVLQRLKADGFERVNPSIIKQSICDAYPDFSERDAGFRKFSDMMKALEKAGRIRISSDESGNMLITIL